MRGGSAVTGSIVGLDGADAGNEFSEVERVTTVQREFADRSGTDDRGHGGYFRIKSGRAIADFHTLGYRPNFEDEICRASLRDLDLNVFLLCGAEAGCVDRHGVCAWLN